MTEFDINTFFTEVEPHLRLAHGQRSHILAGDIQRVRDTFENADCVFLRTDAALRLRLDGNYALQRCAAASQGRWAGGARYSPSTAGTRASPRCSTMPSRSTIRCGACVTRLARVRPPSPGSCCRLTSWKCYPIGRCARSALNRARHARWRPRPAARTARPIHHPPRRPNCAPRRSAGC